MRSHCYSSSENAATDRIQLSKKGLTRPQRKPFVDITNQQCQQLIVVATDPQNVDEYAEDIIAQMRSTETAFVPNPNFMEIHNDINPMMRTVLVDWCVDVHRKFKLRRETLYLAVSLIDRYLSITLVQRTLLQLVGVSAMFVASKFEEIYPPKLADFTWICARAYTTQQILAEEVKLVTALGLNMVYPTIVIFLDVFLHHNQCDAVQRELASYVSELSFLDTKSLTYRPSELAAASVLLTNYMLKRAERWSPAMVHLTQFSENSLLDCMFWLQGLHAAAATSPYEAVKKKFALEKHLGVANLRF